MTSYEFEVAAKNAVIKVIKETYGEDFNIHEIHFTSFSYVLGDNKATMIDCGNNARYYEVTYDLLNNAMYVDVYEKKRNVRIFGGDLELTVKE